MHADLDTLAGVDGRLAHMLVVRDQVIGTAPLHVRPKLSEQWWSTVDELLELRLLLQEQG